MLETLNILQLGSGLSAAVTGRALADMGASVHCLGATFSTPLSAYLNHAKSNLSNTIDNAALRRAAASADLIVCEGGPAKLQDAGYDLKSLSTLNSKAVI